MPVRIDSHQHFWQLSRGDYAWLTPQYEKLYRDYLPLELKPILEKCQIDGTVLVQAAATHEETLFMLKLADEYDFIFGVIGWVDMESPDALNKIKLLSQHKKFRGIRPMIQDIADKNWMLKDSLAQAFQALQKFNLTFDALVLPQHLENLIELAKRYPNLKIVIDHGGKPQIKLQQFETWAKHISLLADNENVFCKLSGLLTESSSEASFDEVQPYLQHLFNNFGSKKLMWGSDYPVLNLVRDYESWFTMCYQFLKKIDVSCINDIFGDTANRFYQLMR